MDLRKSKQDNVAGRKSSNAPSLQATEFKGEKYTREDNGAKVGRKRDPKRTKIEQMIKPIKN